MQIQKTGMRTLLFVVLTMLCFALCAMQFSVFAATKLMDVNSDGTNDLQFDDKNNTITISEITAKLQAKQKWSFGGDTTKNDITITNICGSKATISFDYSVENNGTYGITGGGKDTGSSYTITLDSGEDFTVNLSATAGMMSDATTTFTMTNIKISIAQAVTVTVQHTENGSVNAKYTDSETGMAVNGTVSNGTAAKIDTNGITLTANPNAGKQFVAWVNPNSNTVLSQSVEYEFTPDSAITVKAVFADEEPWFIVDDTTLIQGWSDAFASGSKIVLANNATLPAGNYEVASEQILVVPFDAAGICYTTTPETLAPGSFEAPKAYRTLTMEDGASITVNGTMSVPAKVIAGNTEANRSACRVSGGYGHVKMESGSSITINNGGILSVFGYITGDGEVTANEGANVYESFQIADFRGGTATSSMNFSKKVFPFSQYYIQNIEAKLILYSGAKETAYTALYMSDTILPTSVTFISNSNAMFNLTSGSMVKKYDKATDRLIIDINGEMNISSISIEIKYIMAVTVESSKFPLPITNNMTVNIHSDTTTIGQDLALLPGSEIYIAEGATLKAASGCDVFLYDLDEWNAGNYVYSNVKMRPLYWSPDREKTRTAADLKDAQITVAGTLDGAFYTTSSGAAIKGVEGGKVLVTEGSADLTYQATQSGTDITYPEISVTAPKLQNAKNTDGATETNYTQTTAGTYVYSADHGRWAKDAHKVEDVKTNPTCTEKGFETHTCSCEYSSKTEIPATGHTEVTDGAVAPTCTAPGLTQGTHCSVCRTVLTAQETVPALGHDDGEWCPVKDPTCEKDGENHCKCTRCNFVLVYQYPKALGHNVDHAEAVESGDYFEGTCEDPEWWKGTCQRCDTFVKEIGNVNLNNHVAGSTVTEQETKVGSVTIVSKYCEHCKHTINTTKATTKYDVTLIPTVNDAITMKVTGFVDKDGQKVSFVPGDTLSVAVFDQNGVAQTREQVGLVDGVFKIPELSMLEMNRSVLFVVTDKDGTVKTSKQITFAQYVAAVCEAADGVYTKADQRMVANMLMFGNELQKYVDSNITDADLPKIPEQADRNAPDLNRGDEFQIKLPSQATSQVKFYSVSPYIRENAYPCVYIRAEGYDPELYTVMAKVNNKWFSLERYAKGDVKGTYYTYVLIDGITPSITCKPIEYQVYKNGESPDNGNDPESVTLTYSLMAYANTVSLSDNAAFEPVKPVVYAMVNLFDSANAYEVARQGAAQ